MSEAYVSITDLLHLKQVLVPIHKETTAEEALIFVCKKLQIKPITRHLFGLNYDNNQWASLGTKLSEYGIFSFTLRIRFKHPNFQEIFRLDEQTFNYYFYQVRNDLITNRIEEGSYEKHKEDLLGLSVVDMYRVMVETGMTKDAMIEDYKKYLPKNVISFHKFFVKKPIKMELTKLEQSNNKTSSSKALKEIYLQRFDDMVPDYMTETFSAKMDEGLTEKDVILFVHPFHKLMPGIQFKYSGKEEWHYLCSFDDLCCISLHTDKKAEISRKNGIPVYLKIINNALVSFITLLDGYYRLSVKWTFNLCKDFTTPSLQYLQSIKSHGPVGLEFSYKKLKEKRKNKPGCFILRECESMYDCYLVDVCNKEKKINTYKIELRGEGHFWFSGDEESYSSIPFLIAKHRSTSSNFPLLECIPPSEYDNTNLLLCKPKIVSKKSTEDCEAMDQCPRIISWKQITLNKGQMYEKVLGLTNLRHGLLKIKNHEVEVAVKNLKNNYREFYLQEFLDLAGKWALVQSSSVVRLLGVTISETVSMVSEFFPLGPLNVYLQHNKSNLKEVDLVESATYIASALWHMEREGIVHGYIRCRKILVASHSESNFSVKLCDPGLHAMVAENDWHWIPPELYDSPGDVTKNSSADVWAFGTTLWELFSYGDAPAAPLLSIKDFYRNGGKLTKPDKCSREIYHIICECWNMDPDQRKKPQAAMRDINQILYQVHNARKSHSYTTAKPTHRVGSVDTLNDVGSVMLDDHSEIPSQCTTTSTVDSTAYYAKSFDQQFRVNLVGHNLTFTDEDNTSICSASSVQSIILNDFKIVIQGSIGKGFYGEVYKGYIEKSETLDVREFVAVKKLITDKPSCMADFEREIVIMKNLKHPNIVSMIGVIQHPEISLIMEYVPLGSLKCYLNTNKDGLDRKRLLKYSLDVAEGMDYLGQQKIVHRDLAARNVLVQDENHVKISDFGLAQKMDTSNYYMIKTPRELPLRWYAPESLRDGKFSKFSDVWSYGVLLYEMFSYGGDPIIVLEGGEEKPLLEILQSGARLSCPPHCPVEIYSDLMMPCWRMIDKERPSFISIIHMICSLT